MFGSQEIFPKRGQAYSKQGCLAALCGTLSDTVNPNFAVLLDLS